MPAIYALFDPRTPELVTYVGFATEAARRLRDHRGAWREPSRKGKWVAKLREEGVVPAQRILEDVSWEEKDAAERRWIAHFRILNPRLLNVTDGGSCAAWWAVSDRTKVGPRLSNGRFLTDAGHRESELAKKQAWRDAGRCSQCGGQPEAGMLRCKECQAYSKNYGRRRRKSPLIAMELVDRIVELIRQQITDEFISRQKARERKRRPTKRSPWRFR